MTPRVVAGRFALCEPLGRGGYGEVYRAVQLSVDRDVALKLVHPHLRSRADVVARFEREATLTAKLRHPNAIRIIDFGEDADGSLFLAMELEPGETLKQTIQREQRLPPANALVITRGIADALSRAHALGLVHRDLKPANVILRADTSPPSPVVIDFGLVKVFDADDDDDDDPTVTRSSVMVGTPAYMSPEAVISNDVDGRADVFSLGIMLFEMLTGRRPFMGRTATEVSTMRVHDDAPALPDEFGADLRALVAAMLAREPRNRIAAAAIIPEIDALLAITAEPLDERTRMPTRGPAAMATSQRRAGTSFEPGESAHVGATGAGSATGAGGATELSRTGSPAQAATPAVLVDSDAARPTPATLPPRGGAAASDRATPDHAAASGVVSPQPAGPPLAPAAGSASRLAAVASPARPRNTAFAAATAAAVAFMAVAVWTVTRPATQGAGSVDGSSRAEATADLGQPPSAAASAAAAGAAAPGEGWHATAAHPEPAPHGPTPGIAPHLDAAPDAAAGSNGSGRASAVAAPRPAAVEATRPSTAAAAASAPAAPLAPSGPAPNAATTPAAAVPQAATPADTRGAPAARPSQRADATGRLTVNVNPYGDVWIDGIRVGDAPVRDHRLPAGTHTVQTRYGTERQEATVTITPDAPASITHTYLPQ